jgi:class 3 adenylate cyclase
MNYTALGNSVNLAARLEGLNKEYGTTILVSEAVQPGRALLSLQGYRLGHRQGDDDGNARLRVGRSSA